MDSHIIFDPETKLHKLLYVNNALSKLTYYIGKVNGKKLYVEVVYLTDAKI